MKMGRAAMWVSSKTCLALLALALTAACGKTGTTESGETHFVTCDTDVDCSGVTGAHTCAGGVCRGPANGDDTSPTTTPACAGGCGDSECGMPGTCSLAAACNVVDCGSSVFDENACVRPSCENDDGCPENERCTAIWLSRHYQCEQSGNACDCTAGLGLFPMNVCSPVTLAGPRGVWQKLVVTETVIGDATVHTITPDGSVTVEQNMPGGPQTMPTMTQLSAEDLDELARQINGPGLRLELVNPRVCPVTKATDVVVELFFEDSKLEKNVAGCLSPPDVVVAFDSLMDLVRRY